ncbi:uncharacterized protein EI90DRAFT_3287435 [Cantharellus anzutake]|uniref:uncharacterized protein n=1 Tax=Cantharellus anzutake TaxID=1750568 RepID=UPI0019075692|nr:uncharacterized protein EI90DRAFT_3287435 [Cantharellus anzutake]KAF8336316.1 hypothetical protein EI90DRAFT_3287435 [Cantharellus anzutake]
MDKVLQMFVYTLSIIFSAETFDRSPALSNMSRLHMDVERTVLRISVVREIDAETIDRGITEPGERRSSCLEVGTSFRSILTNYSKACYSHLSNASIVWDDRKAVCSNKGVQPTTS